MELQHYFHKLVAKIAMCHNKMAHGKNEREKKMKKLIYVFPIILVFGFIVYDICMLVSDLRLSPENGYFSQEKWMQMFHTRILVVAIGRYVRQAAVLIACIGSLLLAWKGIYREVSLKKTYKNFGMSIGVIVLLAGICSAIDGEYGNFVYPIPQCVLWILIVLFLCSRVNEVINLQKK